MVAGIFRTVCRLSKLAKLGSYATLCFGCHIKRLGTSYERNDDHGKCNIPCKPESTWSGFSTFLVEAVSAYEKLLDFLGQYLKLLVSESKENW